MNDISVKVVDSPKEVVAVESPPGSGIEVDPLAIEDDVEKASPPAEQKAPICDDNAKEESPSQDEESRNLDLQTDVKETPMTTEEQKDTKSISSIPKETEVVPPTPTNGTDQLDSDEPTVATEYIDPATRNLHTPEPEELAEVIEGVAKPLEFELIPPEATDPLAEKEPITIKQAPIEDTKPIEKKAQSPAELPMEVQVEEKPAVVEMTDIQVAKLPVAVMPIAVMPVAALPIAVSEPIPMAAPPALVQEEKIKVPDKEVRVKGVEAINAGKIEIEIKAIQPVNGDIAKEEQAIKRRASQEVETESPLKRLCQEVERTFPQHDTMINEYIQTTTKNNVDEIQRHTEQLLAEIQTLRELAQKKEYEWNNILHLKKVKEEILLRLLRRKQVLLFEKSAEVNGAERPGIDPFDYLNQAKNLAIDKSDEISGLSIKQPGSTPIPSPMIHNAPVMPVTTHFNPMVGLPPPYDKAAHAHMQNMPKPVFQPMMMPGHMPGFPRDMNGQLANFTMPMGRQGPTKDVKSIIADYRQRNPDITPRRGRRMKSILNPNMMNAPRPIAPKVDSMNNLNSLNNLNMLFNNMDMNQKAMLERLQQIQAGGLQNSIFKDALVQFANMQQASSGLIPNRPMETVTNRPDRQERPERPEHHAKERRRERNHEEHNIKQPERMPSTSPRLPPPPPYPEISLLPVTTSQETAQAQQQNSLLHGILTKNCGEITITPVQPTPPPDAQPEKTEDVVQLDDEESPASEGEAAGSPAGSGRLVIDEAGDADTPLCQGCRRRDALFVCAGCANQWYCSRDCQVAAWDEHSEMCSG